LGNLAHGLHFYSQTKGVNMMATTAKIARYARRAMQCMVGAVAALLFTPAQADFKSVSAEVAKLYSNGVVSETIFQDLYRIDFGPNSAPYYVSDSVTLILETDGNQITKWAQPVNKPSAISDEDKTLILNSILRNVRFDKLIPLKRGKGTQRILLLSAYDCPFCIQFERMLETAGDKVDATFYVVPATLNHNDPARADNVHNIWCAKNNTAVWHKGLVSASQQYSSANLASDCTLGNLDRRDMTILLRSMGVQQNYPFMVAENGLPRTPETELGPFLKQINTGADKKFWDPKFRDVFPATSYSQFRADKAGPRGWFK
jgi:hypothetical protein